MDPSISGRCLPKTPGMDPIPGRARGGEDTQGRESMRRMLVSIFAGLLVACPAPRAGGGVIHGTIWPPRADAKRAPAAHASAPPVEHHGLFDFLGSPGMDRRARPEGQPASARPKAAAPEPKPQGGVVDAVVAVREIPAK